MSRSSRHVHQSNSPSDRMNLYDLARQVTDEVLGEGTYAEIHKNNPNPEVKAAIERWKLEPLLEEVPDPVWCRVKNGFFYWFWCPIFGHKIIAKMDGVELRTRCAPVFDEDNE